MRTILTAVLLALTALSPAIAFGPDPPTAAVVGGNSIVVKYVQGQYGTSSEINLHIGDGSQRPPIATVNGAMGGMATFSPVGRGTYYVTVISQQSRVGSGVNITVP